MLVIPQIEHIDAVNKIDEILDIEGIDSILTGPGDLSATMGLRGQGGHPDVTAAVAKCIRLQSDRNAPAGHLCGYNPESVRAWIGMGISWISVDGDWHTLSRHSQQVAGELRAMRD